MDIEKAINILEDDLMAINEGLEYDETFEREVVHLVLDKEDKQAIETLINVCKKQQKEIKDLIIMCKGLKIDLKLEEIENEKLRELLGEKNNE